MWNPHAPAFRPAGGLQRPALGHIPRRDTAAELAAAVLLPQGAAGGFLRPLEAGSGAPPHTQVGGPVRAAAGEMRGRSVARSAGPGARGASAAALHVSSFDLWTAQHAPRAHRIRLPPPCSNGNGHGNTAELITWLEPLFFATACRYACVGGWVGGGGGVGGGVVVGVWVCVCGRGGGGHGTAYLGVRAPLDQRGREGYLSGVGGVGWGGVVARAARSSLRCAMFQRCDLEPLCPPCASSQRPCWGSPCSQTASHPPLALPLPGAPSAASAAPPMCVCLPQAMFAGHDHSTSS